MKEKKKIPWGLIYVGLTVVVMIVFGLVNTEFAGMFSVIANLSLGFVALAVLMTGVFLVTEGGIIHMLLRAQGKEAKSADPAARAMSWMKTEAMLAMKPGDATTADLISTGCSMGIKSLARYCNQYPTASREAKDIAQSLIRLEDQLVKDMRLYL